MKECESIIAEREDVGVRLSGPEVAKRLVKATATSRKQSGGESEVAAHSGKPMLRYSRTGRGSLTLKVLPRSGASKDELLNAIGRLLDAI